MIVRVLGSAAGGGVPQWNCGCPNCDAVRRGDRPHRSQSSFAISSDGDRWWLVNVSPDVAAQIEAFPPLHPRGPRGTPIVGMLVTDANVDHLGGLAVLRQAGNHAFSLFSSATVREIAGKQSAFAPFLEAPHQWQTLVGGLALDERRTAFADGLFVQAISVSALTPGYDGRRTVDDAALAFLVEDRASSRRVLFAPVFDSVGPALSGAIACADLAFIDGSFWSNEELGNVGVAKAARSLGHLPISGPDGSLRAFAPLASRTRLFYAHLNNTNPLLNPDSAETREANRHGISIIADGDEFNL